MMLDLIGNWPVEPKGSFLIGDKETDHARPRAPPALREYLFTGGDLRRFVAAMLSQRNA